ncbi:hypothetical protein KTO58_01295 [Chitinophaga pendula]|uniref:hypothetical protein n=1 Tax=Chitinophaga TaxID=79328 RepID=UPI000BAEB4C7|nr:MULTISPECIES: hypothetical protein [Chitinophaga]ASZ14502.1 hypothetical protein CK934_27925 [Chitinophaga sp. MD30]UCJ07841.1 hypothetical protein KTO58_01295 [Chitinophaga pendula]
MGETKFGLGQVEKPAPLWYRRLSNALIIFIIPGFVTLIQGWGLSDAIENRWLMVLTFIPAALKGIGVLLGNGQVYTTKNLLLIVAFFFVACKSPQRIARKQEKARQKEMVQLEKVRQQLPCVPVAYKVGVTHYIPGDTIRIIDSSGKTITKVCPPSARRVDTLRILDEAALKSVRDSLASAEYLNGLKEAEIKALLLDREKAQQKVIKAENGRDKWRNIAIPTLCLLGVALVLKFKSIIK